MNKIEEKKEYIIRSLFPIVFTLGGIYLFTYFFHNILNIIRYVFLLLDCIMILLLWRSLNLFQKSTEGKVIKYSKIKIHQKKSIFH